MAPVVTAPLPTLLLTPSDLSKLPSLRKRLQTEHSAIQTSLANAVRDQLATTREGLRKFVEAKQALNRIEDGMREVEGLMEEETGGGTSIAEFRKISKVRVALTWVRSWPSISLTVLPAAAPAGLAHPSQHHPDAVPRHIVPADQRKGRARV